MKKRVLAIFISVLMCFSLVPMSAFAGGSTTYINENGEETGFPTGYSYLNDNDITSLTGGWYVSNTNRTIEKSVKLESDVSLILCDGITLEITGGIIGNDHILTVYGQTNQTGKLIVSNSTDKGNAIDCNLVIYGGNITATAGNLTNNPVDGQNGSGVKGNVNIYRGTLTANGGNVQSGYGGYGGCGILGNVTVDGGTLNAYGGNGSSTGYAFYGQTFTFKDGKATLTAGTWNGVGIAANTRGALCNSPFAQTESGIGEITTGSIPANGLIIKVIRDTEGSIVDWNGRYALNGNNVSYVSFEISEDPYFMTLNNIPVNPVVGCTYTGASLRLVGNYSCTNTYKVKLDIEVEGPEGSDPEVSVDDTFTNENGFTIESTKDYNETTDVSIKLDKEGKYTLTFKLIDLENNNTVLASQSATINAKVHKHDNVEFDKAWTDPVKLPPEQGNYLLETDIDAEWWYDWEVPEGVTNLCLNGHIIKADTIAVGENAVLNIYDCNPNVEHKGYLCSDPNSGKCFWSRNNDEDDSMNCTEKSLYGGVITNEQNCPVITVSGGEFNLYNGTITGCSDILDTQGGGVAVCAGKFIMNGGNIKYNSAVSEWGGYSAGGGVYVFNDATFIMNDGIISDNVAGTGGGVCVEKGGTFIANGGEIINNTSLEAGGGLYLANGTADNMEDPLLTCLAAGTPITLADGSRTAIENLKIGDEVRVFDHETGEISTSKLFDLWKFPQPKDNAFTLHFTNDIDVTAVGGHCFFEKEANEYVVVNTENVNSYIGHDFYNADSACWETLTSVDFLDEAVDTYIIVSEKNFNTFANGMLSNVDGLYATLCNIFDFDENLKIDAEKKAADIEEYGLWNYDSEHFQYVTEDTYNALNLQYLGVAIGKGILTPEELAKSAQDTVKYNTDLVRPEMLNQSDSGNKPAPTRSNLSASSMFSPVKSMKLLGAPEPTPAPEPVEPGVYLGGSIKITDNTSSISSTLNAEEDNVFLWDMNDAPKINVGDGNVALTPTKDMSVGITRLSLNIEKEIIEYVPGAFSNNGTYDDLQYFFSDCDEYIIAYNKNGYLTLMAPGIAENTTTLISYSSITAALDAAQSGETVKLLENFTENKYIEVKPNVTFDLNGLELTTDKAVIVFGTLVDTDTEHSGKLNLVNTKMLVYNTDKITISNKLDTYQNVNVLPVWNKNAKSYSLYSVTSFGTEWETNVDKPQYNFSMTSGDFDAIFADDSNVEVHVCLYYTNSEGDDVSCDYLIGSSIVEEYIQDAENSHIYVAFTGTDNLTNMKACTYLKAKDCSFSIGSITRNYDIN